MSVMLTVVLLVGGENVTMKSRSIASGIITGTIGTTTMKGRYIHNLVVRLYLYKFNIRELTPADN